MSDETKCPACGAGFSDRPDTSEGWWYAICDRGWHKERNEWESHQPRACLLRQIANLKFALSEANTEYENICLALPPSPEPDVATAVGNLAKENERLCRMAENLNKGA